MNRYFNRKLKPAKLGSEFMIPSIALPVFLIIVAIWGIRAAWGALAIIEFPVVLMHMNMYFRTKNKSFLWLAAAFLIIVIFAIYISIVGMSDKDPWQPVMIIAACCAIAIMGYIVLNKRIKWRTREILELAAMPVVETKNGFTERPLALGKIAASPEEIHSFSHFIYKNLIAIPYSENDKIIFSLTNSYWKQNGLKKGYKDESWISFSGDGNVNVFISRNDYLLYQEAFSFDQLCENLGNVFTEFFEMFRKGEGIRIIDKLNALNLNPITE